MLGLSAGMARYIPIAVQRKDHARLWGIIQTGVTLSGLNSTALAIVLFLLAEPLSNKVFNQPDLVPVLRLASLSIPLNTLMNLLTSVTQGFKRMEYKVYSQDITLNLGKLILSIVLIGIGLGVTGALLAHVIALMITVGLLFYFVHGLFPLIRPWRSAKRNTGEMLHFTLPVYLSRLLSNFSGNIETMVIGSFGVMSGVGVYTTALRVSGIGGLFHQSLQSIAVPIISDLHSQGKLKQLRRVYQTLTKWGLTFNLPVFLTIVLFAKPLLNIFGDDFVSGASSMIILAFAALFNAGTGPCGSIVTMTGRSKMSFANSVIYLVINIILDLLFIPPWGAVGAAIAVTLTSVLINVLRVTEIFILYRIWPYNKSFLKPITAALLATGTTYLVKEWLTLKPMLLELVVGSLLLWSIYFIAIVLLKLSDEDRLILNRLWHRFSAKRS
jgi:O-antigen/teichoic acid export membrane protein